MLLGNSGDDNLMKLLRWRAMGKGLALNEYGMGKRDDKLVSV
jgi:DNA polymerase beta